jgi:cytochrome c oxidase cbb3-type subunit III
MSSGWSLYIIIITLVNILGCLWLIIWTTKKRTGEAKQGEVTGHTWDGDLQEYNNPLPRWWLWLFIITIIFAFAYLYYYPGLGNYAGSGGWSQRAQYEEEMSAAKANYDPLFVAYAQKPIPELAKDKVAMESGHRLFLNYCAACHGSDAGGSPGFPNLTDGIWLYGGDPETIKTTILDGRMGVMPPMGAGLNETQLNDLTAYVISLSGRDASAIGNIDEGNMQFANLCVACHGADGKGNMAAGFPNLTDNDWLYGGTPGAIKQTLTQGRNGKMPAHREFLGEEKVHLLAAYIYSLNQ